MRLPDSDSPSPVRKNVYVICNPTAGRIHSLFDPALDTLKKLGVACESVKTSESGHAQRLAREAATSGRYDAVVAAGGDGTINEVIHGLADCAIPLGIIPLGTANVLALEIDLKFNPDSIARTIAFGETQDIHLGRVEGRLFFLMVSAGFDARVVQNTSAKLKKLIGKGAYAFSGFCQFFRAPASPFEVTVDGAKHPAAWVIVSNTRLYGGKFLLAPDAGLTNSGFSVVLFSGRGRWGLLKDLWEILCGRTGYSSRTKILQGTDITIEGDPSEPVQADGDLAGTLPVTITSAPHRIKLIVPDR